MIVEMLETDRIGSGPRTECNDEPVALDVILLGILKRHPCVASRRVTRLPDEFDVGVLAGLEKDIGRIEIVQFLSSGTVGASGDFVPAPPRIVEDVDKGIAHLAV